MRYSIQKNILLFSTFFYITVIGHEFGPQTLIYLSNNSSETIHTLCLHTLRNKASIASYDINNHHLISKPVKIGKQSKTNCYIKLSFDTQHHNDIIGTPAQEFYKDNMDKHYKEIVDSIELAKTNYKGQFCCFDMDSMLDNDDELYNVNYSPKAREYYLKSLKGPYCRTIEFCPWCGSELPKSLSDEWFDILEKEYGLDMPKTTNQMDKIPAEFKTDEWWKKRGL